MKKRLLSTIIFLVAIATAYAVPAKPGKTIITQPDGTTLTITLHGDEFVNFTTTADGYTVVKDTDGFYKYAALVGGSMVASSVVAHDAAVRDLSEQAFLSQTKKMQRSPMTEEQQEFMQRSLSIRDIESKSGSNKAPNKARYDYSKFKGLIVLVEFNDKKFTMSSPLSFYNTLVNTDNLTQYTLGGVKTQCTGSVRDYYRDNSNGIFNPSFDIVGPVTINYNAADAKQNQNIANLAMAALRQVNPTVNFKDYDVDNNGTVDMVYFLFAGYGSNISANNSDYVWPHAGDLGYTAVYYGFKLDDCKFGRYACSTEISDVEGYGTTLDGIGTICHEFTHVLGLQDHYDTDYEENGQSNDPGIWDVMAGGSYRNNGLTPVGYNAYEKYSLGFMSSFETIGSEGSYTLEPLNESNTALRLNTLQNKEYFILENRQRTRWDEYLPGHGMLIWRVDSTNTSMWTSNLVNAYPNHNYFELLRANNATSPSPSDPFPGTANIREVSNVTIPSLLTWAGLESPYRIYDITEDGQTIYFQIGDGVLDTADEPFESLALTTADVTGVNGAFCKWDLQNALVVATGSDYGNGNRVVELKRNGTLTSSPMAKPVHTLRFTVWNQTTSNIIIKVATSTDNGATWNYLVEHGSSTANKTISRKSNEMLNYLVDAPSGARLRIELLGSKSTASGYIDDLLVVYGDEPTAISLPETDRQQSPEHVGDLYNIQGMKVGKDYNGLIISNGKKYLNK